MKKKKNPMRKCLGCMESKTKDSLIRIAWYEGRLSVDPTGKAKGRGVYLCKNRECIEMARKKKAIQRSLHIEVSAEEEARIFEELKAYEE